MVQSRKVELEVKIEVDVPLDIVNDKERLTGVKNGLIRSISNGLYQQGVSFRIDKASFEIK
ncbi:MAG: hypothetical protein WA364_00745 [Candidatus Nitrosopolaris sp.]|jgi:hypothetical protein